MQPLKVKQIELPILNYMSIMVPSSVNKKESQHS